MLFLVRLDVNSSNNDVLLAMLVLGIGVGFGMSLYTLIVQNALPGKLVRQVQPCPSSARLAAPLRWRPWGRS
jgi:hypothetical protein